MYIPDIIPKEDRQELVKGGYGGDITIGDNIAVLVVDMTEEFVSDEYPTGFSKTGKPAVEKISKLTDFTKKLNIRTYYLVAMNHIADHPLKRGQWAETTESAKEVAESENERISLAAGLSPTNNDVIMKKYKPSAFFGTQLESMLNLDSIDTLIITGMTTSGCIRATVNDAFSYNYNVIIPKECVADRSRISHEVELFDMGMKYGQVLSLDKLIDVLENQHLNE